MKPAQKSGAGLIVLAIGGMLALNYPLLSLFDRSASVFGIPLAFVHLFIVWALLIGGIAVLAERHGDNAARRDANDSSGVSKPRPGGPPERTID